MTETPQTETRNDAVSTSRDEGPGEARTTLPDGPPLPGEEPKNYGALKGYFYTPKRGDIRGAFCLLFNGGSG